MTYAVDIRERYKRFYEKVKADAPDHIERLTLNRFAKERLLSRIRALPHPSVCSILDIEVVCRDFVSGPLETLYQYFGEEARSLRSAMEQAPYATETREVAVRIDELRGMSYALFDIRQALALVTTATDLTLKSQCPYCHQDLITVIVGDELRLRCRNQTNDKCKTTDWFVTTLKQRSPP